MTKNYQKSEERVGLILRGRDVAFDLQGVEADPKLLRTIMQLAEIQHVHSKAIADMGAMLEKMTDLMLTVTHAQGNISQEVEKFRRTHEIGNDPAPDLTSFPNQEGRIEDGNQ